MGPPIITPPITTPTRPPVAAPPTTRPVGLPVTKPIFTPPTFAATPPPARPPFRVPEANANRRASGVVRKAPHFYEAYTGPKLAELNAVGATAKLMRNGNFVFTGTNQGKINQAPAVYVWGIDRSGSLGPGPFTNRPNIRFDAVVVVTLDTSHHLSAKVVDLASGTPTDLPAGAARIRGKTVSVTVPSRPAPLDGPGHGPVPVQLLARGRRPAGLLLRRQLRAGVHHRSGRIGEVR